MRLGSSCKLFDLEYIFLPTWTGTCFSYYYFLFHSIRLLEPEFAWKDTKRRSQILQTILYK
jgi:hypothetical protein